MAFISLFEVIGPNMVGPSSSHTAGAASMALLARKLFPGEIKEVHFILYGSFAKTYRGHGTDRALMGGMLGFETDDLRIRVFGSGILWPWQKKQGSAIHLQFLRRQTAFIPILQIWKSWEQKESGFSSGENPWEAEK